jgi:hypothetical protein
MIKVIGKRLFIPNKDRLIGFEGDNRTGRLYFSFRKDFFTEVFGSESDLSVSAKLQASGASKAVAYILTPVADLSNAQESVYELEILSGMVQAVGEIKLQLIILKDMGKDENQSDIPDLEWNSETQSFYACDSLDFETYSGSTGSAQLDAFKEILSKIGAKATNAVESATAASESAASAKGYAEAAEKAAAETETNANAAAESANTAAEKASEAESAAGAAGKDAASAKASSEAAGGLAEKAAASAAAASAGSQAAEKAKGAAESAKEAAETAKAAALNAANDAKNEAFAAKSLAQLAMDAAGAAKAGAKSASDNAAASLSHMNEAARYSEEAKAAVKDFDGHIGSHDNPHKVTASQVGAYSKAEIDTALAGKLDKVKSLVRVYPGVYATESTDGTPQLITATSDLGYIGTGSGYIPLYDSGELKTGVPTSDDSATNKAYVDGKIDGIKKIALPSYWETALETAVTKARAKQNLAGNKCVNFVMLSDIHADVGLTGYVQHIGNIAQNACERLNIPLVAMLGDHVTASISESVTDMAANGEECMQILKNIPADNLLNVLGNHDINGGTGYVTSLTQAETFNILLRKESQDFRRVWDADGRYFYLDNTPQKTRFICLYTNWWDKSILDGNTVSLRYQDSFGFGQVQLDFFVNALSTVGEGWNIVILQHAPPSDMYNWRDAAVLRGIVNAYKTRKTYTGSYAGTSEWMNVSVTCDFTAAKGDIIAIFCGHLHQDKIYPEGSSFAGVNVPVISVTCATNSQYGVNPQTRTLGTASETALDIVTIDAENHNIYMTRIGDIGNDRETAYTVYTPSAGYTNQIPISVEPSSDSIYHSVGYWKSSRISSSSQSAVAVTSGTSPVFTTGLIPCKKGDVIRLKNCWIDPDGTAAVYGQAPGGCNTLGYNSDKTVHGLLGSWLTFDVGHDYFTAIQYDSDGNVIQFTMSSAVPSSLGYIQLTLGGNAETAILTINEEITESEVG